MVTAEDFVYSWRRLVDPKSDCAKNGGLLEGIVKNSKEMGKTVESIMGNGAYKCTVYKKIQWQLRKMKTIVTRILEIFKKLPLIK